MTKRFSVTALAVITFIVSLLVSCGEDPFFFVVTYTSHGAIYKEPEVFYGGTEITLPEKPDEKGDFLGWNVDGETMQSGEKVTVRKNLVIDALWRNEIVITYSINGQTFTQTVTDKSVFPDTNGITLSGYVLDGWYTEENGEGTFYEAGEPVTVTKNMTLYAHWVDKSVDFILDDASGTYSVKMKNDALSEAVEVVIPSVYRGKKVDAIAADGFKNASKLTSVTIPSSVETIREGAFESCTALESFEVPSGVTLIGEGAFQGNTSLSSFTFASPSSISEIGNSVFSGDTSLKKIKIPESIETIAANAFSGSSLENISFSKDESEISGSPWGAPNTAVIKFNEKSITYEPNGGTGEALSVSVNKGSDATVGDCSFTYSGFAFDSWNTSSDGSGTTYTASSVISSVSSDMTLYAVWVDEDIEFTALGTTPETYSVKIKDSRKGEATSVVIPAKYHGLAVTEIDSLGFQGANKLINVTITESITKIGDGAFAGCTALTSVTIPDSVTSLGGGVFYGCSSLTSAALPDNSSVTSLDSFDFGSSIGKKGFFEGCVKLTGVTTPSSVTEIGDYAFRNCTLLASVTYDGNITAIGDEAYENCSKLEKAVIPASLATLGKGAFASSGIKTIDFSGTSTLSEISESAFENCSSLSSVTIPTSITTIGKKAFASSGISTVNLSSAQNLGESSFESCSSLTSITIPTSVTTIGDRAFASTGLTSLYFSSSDSEPSRINKIGNNILNGNTGVTALSIPGSIETIESSAFSGSAVKSITIAKDTSDGPADSSGSNWGAGSDASVRYNEFYITYFVNGGSGTVPAVQSIKKGSNPVTISSGSTLSKSGYVFDSWNTSSDGNGTYYIEGDTYSTVADLNLYAVWVDARLEFSPNGTTPETYSVKLESSVSASSVSEITIPGKYHGLDVTIIKENGFKDCTGLTSVVIPSSINEIGSSAFEGCTNLEAVTYETPSSVENIGSKAFKNTKLESVTVPSSVEIIGDEAFASISSLIKFEFADESEIATIGSKIIDGSSESLEEIEIPGSVNSIASDAFSGTSVTTIKVDENSSSAPSGEPWGAELANVTYSDSEAKSYTISYDAGSGIKVKKTPFNTGDTVTLSSSVSKDGYTFDGWYTEESGKGTYYGAGEAVIVNFTSDTTLYANWIDSNFAISSDGVFSVLDKSKVSLECVIPSQYKGKAVTAIASDAFKDCTALTKVTIPSSVTTIGSGAFSGCTGLNTEVVIPESVTTIGEGVFSGATNLSSLKFASSINLESIPKDAFKKTAITAVTIPETVKTIGEGAFSATALTSVTIPSNVESLGENVFSDCSSLASVTFNTTKLTAIPDGAFQSTALTEVVIPSGVTSIGENAYNGISTLNKVSVPESVTTIGTGAFTSIKTGAEITIDKCSGDITTSDWCDSTTTVTYSRMKVVYKVSEDASDDQSVVQAKNSSITLLSNTTEGFDGWYTESDGEGTWYGSGAQYTTSSNDTDTLYAHWVDENLEFIEDTSVTPHTYSVKVKDSAKSSVTTIEIPKTYHGLKVTAIADYGFDDCTALTGVSIPDTVTAIGKESFSSTAITGITIPSSVTTIGDGAFSESKLTAIVLPDTVTSLRGGVFYNCEYLTSVTLPTNTSVTSLASYDFGTAESADVHGFFEGCSKLTSVATPDNITTIGDYAFKNCSELTEVTYEGAVTAIGKEAFYNCSKLSTAVVPEGVTKINEKTFSGCSSLSTVTIGKGITSIASDAFENCENLLLISIDKTTSEITAMTGEDIRWGAGETCAVCGNTEEVYVAALVDDEYAASKTVTMKVWKEEEDGTKLYKVGTESQGVTVSFNNLGVSGGGGFYTIKVPSGDFNRVEIKTSKQTHEYTIDLASNPNNDVMLTLAYSSTYSKILYEVQYNAKGTLSKWYDESKVTKVDSYTYVTAIIVDQTLRSKTSTAKMWITSKESGTTKYHLGTSSGITVTSKEQTFTVKVPTSTFTDIKITAGGSTWTCTVDLASNPGKDIMWLLQSPNIIKYVEKDSFASSAGTVTY